MQHGPPKAYVLYRIGRLPEAAKLAADIDGDRRSEALQLAAQLHFRMGDAKESIAAYEELTREFKVRACVFVCAFVC